MKTLKVLSATRKATLLWLAVAAVFAIGMAPAAHADAVYDLKYDGCSESCGPQDSFGTVTLHQTDANTVTITVSLLNDNKFVTTGSHTGFAFNILGGAVTVGTLPDGWSNKGANNEPGFGHFSNGIDCDKGNTNNADSCAGNNPWVGDLIFDVTRGSGLSLDDFAVNGDGYLFATDIISGTTGKTGLVAADGNQGAVPEPGTLAMLGTGVLGFAGLLRRKLSN